MYNDSLLDKFLILESPIHQFFLYYRKYGLLIPVLDDNATKTYDANKNISLGEITISNKSFKYELLKTNHAVEVFGKLKKIEELKNWNICDKLWMIDDFGYYSSRGDATLVYNGICDHVQWLASKKKVNVLKVIYLSLLSWPNIEDIDKYLEVVLGLKERKNMKKNPSGNNLLNIQDLLDCDKRRCGLSSYEKEILYDIRAGHWDLFENPKRYKIDEKMVARDPHKDIKRNGVIGIDFGTKSTVVVKQEGRNEIRPIRIGSLSLSANVADNDYENPTIISCMSIDNFLKKYQEKKGRPETSCEDMFVSYNAYEDYKNCSTDNFYGFYSELKQWANKEKQEIILQDIKDKRIFKLAEDNSIEKSTLNPIEIYAYYIGMYINNMKNGIYLKYIMSFPVKYSKTTKELIRKSFENGIKKSLPNTIVEDSECMSEFSVKYEISEPAAYAVTALEQTGFKPKDENEKYLYGIFDFGGGTTDFDFGVWRGASDEEYDKYNCDFILECFGADSDVHLGGENILEMLAYHVFRDNKNMAAEKKIACSLPVDEVAFIGGENLINNSQSANRNLTILKEALRPLWEQHENWEEKYHKKNVKKKEYASEQDKLMTEYIKVQMYNSVENTGKNRTSVEQDGDKEYLELQMYDFSGKAVPNCRFIVDTNTLIDLIKKRIEKGVKAFFNCIEKSILNNETAQHASEKIYIFLAGNSCKSAFVKEVFDNTIKEYNKEYGKIKGEEQDRFELIEPLKSCSNMNEYYVPNAKTSVAYGLVKSRPGGKIYIKKNYETDSNVETRFKYYLGGDRRGLFDCKFSPTIKCEDGTSKTSYNMWNKFQGAGMGIARIYYTDDPRSDSKIEKISIDNIPFHEISFEADENKYLFVRAISPSVIEYAISESENQIGNDIFQLDIDSE